MIKIEVGSITALTEFCLEWIEMTGAAKYSPAAAQVLAEKVSEPAAPAPVPTAPMPVPNVPTPAPATPAPTPAPTPVPVAQQPAISLDDIARAGAQLRDAGKMADIFGLLQEFGIQSIQQLQGDAVGRFAARLRALGAQI